MSDPSDEELRAAYDNVAEIHQTYLQQLGVTMPGWGTSTGYQLAALMHFSPQPVHKDTISSIVRKRLPDSATDQQVRHLGLQYGWNLEPAGPGEHRIIEPEKAHYGFLQRQHARASVLTASSFGQLKERYGNRCATCGGVEGRPDPRYMTEPIVLQQAHMDPHKELNIENTIPQCQFCNQAYKDDFVFSPQGRVRAIASERPVLRASKAVMKRVWEALKNKKFP